VQDLVGKVAVITGASRGLGLGMARQFGARGLKLGLCSRSVPAVDAGPGFVAAALDVRDSDAMDRFAERVADHFGPIDLWINNAGVLEPVGPVRDTFPAEFEANLTTNVGGVFNGTRSFLRHRDSVDGGGVLINISSGAALAGRAGWAAYCASKAAVDRITETVQLEERARGLVAFSVSPGVVDTAMQELIRSTPEERFPSVGDFIALKDHEKFNDPAYVAEQILTLAFDPANRPEQVVHRIADQPPDFT